MKLVSPLRFALVLGTLAVFAPSPALAGGVCANDTDCGGPNSGRVCNPVSLMCTDGCRASGGNGCAMNAPCTSTNTEIGACSTACVALPSECLDPALPLCNTLKMTCVECLTDLDCGGQTCDQDTSLCPGGGGTGGAGGGGVGGGGVGGGAGVGGAGGGTGGGGVGGGTTGAGGMGGGSGATTGADMATTGAGTTANAAGTGGAPDVTGLAAEGGGCDCSAVGDGGAFGDGRGGLALAALGALAALVRRRRRQ